MTGASGDWLKVTSYFGERPIREVKRADASAFVDALRQLDPAWARTGKGRTERAGCGVGASRAGVFGAVHPTFG